MRNLLTLVRIIICVIVITFMSNAYAMANGGPFTLQFADSTNITCHGANDGIIQIAARAARA